MDTLPPAESGLDIPQSEGEPRDLEALYASALHVTEQWLLTHQATGNPRHFRTALACAQIAREHYGRLEAERRARRLNNPGPFARRQAAFREALVQLDAAMTAAE